MREIMAAVREPTRRLPGRSQAEECAKLRLEQQGTIELTLPEHMVSVSGLGDLLS